MFKNFLVNDIGFEVGGNYGSQTDFLAEETTVGVFGLNFDIAIPKPLGTLLVGIMADKEFTFNAFNACGNAGFGVAVNGSCTPGGGAFSGDREFEWTWRFETFYNLPLGGILGSWADAAHIVNIANVIGPKGTGISQAQRNASGAAACSALGFMGSSALNNNETKTEVFEDVRLSSIRRRFSGASQASGTATSAIATGTTSSAPIITPPCFRLSRLARRSKAPLTWARPITSNDAYLNFVRLATCPALCRACPFLAQSETRSPRSVENQRTKCLIRSPHVWHGDIAGSIRRSPTPWSLCSPNG